jgi:phage terminase large subunit-like protein
VNHQDILNACLDPARFRELVLIDSDKGAVPLAKVLDDWQAKDFLAMDPAWQRLIGLPTEGAHRVFTRAWLERPRGHSKTLDLAIAVLRVLLASRRPLVCVAAAGDRDQARLLRDAIAKLVQLNTWMQAIIEVQAYRVIAKDSGSTLDILSADANTSFGLTPDLILIDEITHWSDAGQALWNSLFSAAAKRSHCVLVSICNAGVIGSWQHKLRELVRQNENWYFSRLEGPVASWISQATLAEQYKLLVMPSAVQRYWYNQWISASGDAIDPADLDFAFQDLPPMEGKEKGWRFAGGLDLATSRDWAAFAVVAKNPKEGIRRLAKLWVWKPPAKGKQIDLDEVRKTVRDAHKAYKFFNVGVDPYQAVLMCQQLAADHVPVEEIAFTGQNLNRMAADFTEAFTSRSIQIPKTCVGLKEEIERLSIVPKSYGYRLEINRVAGKGHGDRATALALALLAVRDAPPRKHCFVICGSVGDIDEDRGIPVRSWEDVRRAAGW